MSKSEGYRVWVRIASGRWTLATCAVFGTAEKAQEWAETPAGCRVELDGGISRAGVVCEAEVLIAASDVIPESAEPASRQTVLQALARVEEGTKGLRD